MKKRCPWCEKDDLYRAYHDDEWGELQTDDRKLFEMIVLESMQAGISWHVVLKKREAMRAAFDGFDPQILAGYDGAKIDALMQTEGIIKNRAKLTSLAANAKAFLAIKREFGGFYAYLCRFTGGRRIVNNWTSVGEVPATTPLSDALAEDMKRRGFKFFGSTTAYAFLQSMGAVDDHLLSCFKRERL